jgi:hypothetical protein
MRKRSFGEIQHVISTVAKSHDLLVRVDLVKVVSIIKLFALYEV